MHILTIIAITIGATSGYQSALKTFDWNSEFWNYISHYRNISEYSDLSTIQCAAKCASTKECMSFFHQLGSGFCQLHSFDFPRGAPHHTFVASSGTRYFQKENSCKRKGYTFDIGSGVYFKPKLDEGLVTHWDEALRICQKESSRLLVVHSEQLLHNVGNQLRTLDNGRIAGYWVGARVNTTVNEFMWTDGSTLARSSPLWNQSSMNYDPVTAPSAQCVAVLSFAGYQLDDMRCDISVDVTMFPLCECRGSQ